VIQATTRIIVFGAPTGVLGGTKRVADALEVENKNTVLVDRDLPDFGKQVHPTGKKVYLVQAYPGTAMSSSVPALPG